MKILFAVLLAFSAAAPAQDLDRVVAMMARIGFANTPSFSPDGKRIAFITGISGVGQIWIVPHEGGWPDQVTALEDPVLDLEWSPDGRWIAFSLAPGGGLNEQTHVVRPDGTGLRRLTAGGKENNWLGTWTPDSKSLLISSNKRSGAAMDSYVLDASSGEMRLIAENPGTGTINDVSSDGKYAILRRVVSRGDSNVYRVATDGSGERLLTPHKPPANFGGEFGHNSSTIYLATNADRDMTAFGRVSIEANGAVSPVEILASRDDAELSFFDVNSRGTFAVLVWNVSGRSELIFMDLTTRREYPGPRLPGDIVSGTEFSPDDTKLALIVSGANRPQDLWVIEVGTGQARQITRVPHAGVDLESLIRPELIRYTAHDGEKLSAWLYRPRSEEPPYPAVFSFHGGPESQERPFFSSTYQALLAQGIAVIAPNVRGSSGFGKRFVNLDNGPLRVNGVRDIKASVDHAVKSGLADSKRLGIMGGSYGGYMVMAGLAEYPEMFAAGMTLAGVVNFETFFKNTEPWMAAISTIEYGDPATQAAMLRDLSPIHKVGRVKTPLLVLHGANDTNVPVIEAEQVVANLRERNVPVEYILFPDEGHGWRKTPNRIRSTVAIVNFFVKHLK